MPALRLPTLKSLSARLGRRDGVAADARGRVVTAAPAALLLATGAGAALWWWTQWARGRAESEAADAALSTEDLTGTEG